MDMRTKLDEILNARMQVAKDDIKAEIFASLRSMSVQDLMDVLHGGGPVRSRAPLAKRGPGRPKTTAVEPSGPGGPVLVERILDALAVADRPLALGEICRMVQGGKGYVSEKLTKLRKAGKTEMRGEKASAKHGLVGKFNDDAWKSAMGKNYVASSAVTAEPAAPEEPAEPAQEVSPAEDSAPASTPAAKTKTTTTVVRRPKRAAAG